MASRVVVVLQTYARTGYAVRTIEGVGQHLHNAGGLAWYVCDDGSSDEHLAAVKDTLRKYANRIPVIGGHSERLGYGAGANKAWHVAHDHADITLWLEDDWVLARDLDITPYVDLLNNDDSIGMVRLGHLPIGLHNTTVGHNGIHYLNMHFTMQYTFSGNPALRHRRFREWYGAYPEGLNPGNTEINYDEQVRANPGPSILWPVDIGGWGIFQHIGEEKSYVS